MGKSKKLKEKSAIIRSLFKVYTVFSIVAAILGGIFIYMNTPGLEKMYLKPLHGTIHIEVQQFDIAQTNTSADTTPGFIANTILSDNTNTNTLLEVLAEYETTYKVKVIKEGYMFTSLRTKGVYKDWIVGTSEGKIARVQKQDKKGNYLFYEFVKKDNHAKWYNLIIFVLVNGFTYFGLVLLYNVMRKKNKIPALMR